MKFIDSEIGTIQNRYKRFLSDITLSNGDEINAHVPNTGKMSTCWEPGWKVLVTNSNNPKRKLPYTLELTHNGKTWISVNTARTNKLVLEALENKVIEELKDFDLIRPEVKAYESRLDFHLSKSNSNEEVYLEVKNATLTDNQGTSLFPDAVSTRGQKHIKDLIKVKESGHRAIMFYVVNREDVNTFSIAKDIDPDYARLLSDAVSKGVEVLAYQSKITDKEIKIYKKIEVKI